MVVIGLADGASTPVLVGASDQLQKRVAKQFGRALLEVANLPDVIARCRTMLRHTHIDWAAIGYNDRTLDELIEFLLRNIQSMIVAPTDPPRSGALLRAYLRRWIGPALTVT